MTRLGRCLGTHGGRSARGDALLALCGAGAASLAHLDLPTALAAPALWAACLVAARRGGWAVVAAISGVVMAPVVAALFPRGLAVTTLGAAAVGLWPLAVFGGVRLGRPVHGAALAAAAHLGLDWLGDASGLPIRSPAATAETVLALPALWPAVRVVGFSAVDVLLVGSTVLGGRLVAQAWRSRAPARVVAPGAIALGAVVWAPAGAGDRHRAGLAERGGGVGGLRVGVVAPRGRPGEARLTAVSLAARRRERRDFMARTRAMARAGVELVVWPENGYGGGLVPALDALAAADLGQTAVLAAGDLYRSGHSVAALAWVAPDRAPVVREKVRAVPGVEAEPERDELSTFEVAGRRLVPLLCFESVWRDVVRRAARAGEVVVVQSDASSFAHTSLPRLHWRLSAMLALEQGVSLLFVAREGGVGLLDPRRGRTSLREVPADGAVHLASRGASPRRRGAGTSPKSVRGAARSTRGGSRGGGVADRGSRRSRFPATSRRRRRGRPPLPTEGSAGAAV